MLTTTHKNHDLLHHFRTFTIFSLIFIYSIADEYVIFEMSSKQEEARNHNNGLCFRIPLNLDYVVFQRGIWKKDRNLIWQFHWIRIHFTSREINRSQKNSIILKVLSMYYANSRPFLSYIIILSEKGSNSSKSHRFHQNHMQNVYFSPVLALLVAC